MRASWSNLVVILAISMPLAWCFGPMSSGSRVFAYRDAAHFYYPLEAWVCACWARGQWPLWNAQDGNGLPVVADATSAVFYPVKLVFALPLEFPQRYAWYVILHVLVAAAGAYGLARHWHPLPRGAGVEEPGTPRCGEHPTGSWSAGQPPSRFAAALCAITYTFGGAVLFQYCNVVFLVGAAWLPWALLATHRMLTERNVVWALGLGACLALMVLGGDPQSAYHAGLLSVLYAVIARRATPTSNSRTGSLSPGRTLSLLTIAGLSGMLLAAVQIVPAWSWVHTSNRMVFTYPRSVYEIPDYLRRDRPAAEDGDGAERGTHPDGWSGVAQGLWGAPVEGEHHRQAYRFSVAPWRLMEMLWPNVSGRTFPQHHRWLTAAGGEDAIWCPSLYLGILPLLLGAGTWRLRRADVRVRWFSWMFLLAAVASFGWYGLGWLLQAVRSVFDSAPSGASVAEPVGGLYWLMTVWLPGYVHFRYPAKLMVVATLAMAGLAGVGLDQMLFVRRDRVERWLRNLGMLSLLAAAAALVSRSWWLAWLAEAPPDELYGPLDSGAAWRDVLTACLHTATVCAAGWWCVRLSRRHAVPLKLTFLLLTACEIAWANGWMVLSAPASAMAQQTVLRGVHDPTTSSSAVYRWPSRTWVPPAWRATESSDRAEETVRWDAATMYAKLHLLGPHRSLLPQSTMAASDFRSFVMTGSQGLPHPAVLDVLGVEYLIVPDDVVPRGTGWTEAGVGQRFPGVRLWQNAHAFPRAWIVHHVAVWPSWKSADPRLIRPYYGELVFPRGEPRDFRKTAVVECDAPAALPALRSPTAAEGRESVQVRAEDQNNVSLEVTLAAPGLVVLNQFSDPRWVVDITSDARASYGNRVVRTNRIMQGVFLPAGTHALVFRYAPRDLLWAGAASVASWLAVLAVFSSIAWRRRRAR